MIIIYVTRHVNFNASLFHPILSLVKDLNLLESINDHLFMSVISWRIRDFTE